MPGWTEFNVNDVDLSPKPIAPGAYTLQLVGAYPNKFNETKTDVVFRIVGETPEAGKTVRMEIPDIAEFAWAGEAYARLISVLGVEAEPYTHPVQVLTAAAGNGAARLTARVYTDKYTKKDGSEGWRNQIAPRSLRASA